MPPRINLWEIDGRDLREIKPQRLNLEKRLEDWLERDVSILGEDLLIIGRQVSTDFGHSIDLLCLDRLADVVVLELKKHRTPRDATAQLLDYASWVVNLSNERIGEIANDYLRDSGPLEAAFRNVFDEDLPDVVNETHRLILVASEIDSSSERIIEYLSEEHGVSINAATFQYFQHDGREVLGRVFLLEPEQVEYRAKTRRGSKRKPNLTREQLEEIANENGVGDLYGEWIEILSTLFPRCRTTRSSLGFEVDLNGNRRVVFNLIPGESSRESGLRYQAYSSRIAKFFNVEEKSVTELLPSGREDWEYTTGAERDWRGYTGFVQNVAQGQRFIDGLLNARMENP